MSMLTCLRDSSQARHGGLALRHRGTGRAVRRLPDFLDAAAFTVADPIMGERIFAAVVPQPGECVAEAEFRDYLEELDVAPFKLPEKLVVVTRIPRDGSGRVQRELILEQI